MTLKKGGVKSSSKKPLKKRGVKSSSKMPLKKRGGTDNPPESVLALLAKKGVYALAENMQTAHGPRSALSAIHGRTPKTPENPPLEKPQRAKTVNGPSLKLKGLIKKLHEPQYNKIWQESKIKE